jgi:hypothetical protein
MTDEQSDQPEQNPGRTRRAVNFIARRGGINRAFEGTRKGAEFIGDITNRLRPRWFDRKGLTGRYLDGGITRFQNLTDGMSEFELGDQYRGWLMQRACFQYATLGAVLAIPLGFVFFQMSKFFIFGLIGLSGIVINDSIILVAVFRRLHAKGQSLYEATVAAATSRLRPVILTSVTTMAGLSPLLFETSIDAALLKPIAVGLVFGLGFGTVLILLMVPVLLYKIGQLTDWASRRSDDDPRDTRPVNA